MNVVDMLDKIIREIEEEKKSLFATRKTMDLDTVLALVQQIRSALPRDIVQARQIVEERDQILQDARELASDMVEEARQRTEDEVVRHKVVQQAYQESDEVLSDARQQAYELKTAADDYALSVLDDLTSYISEYTSIIQENKTNFLNRKKRREADLNS